MPSVGLRFRTVNQTTGSVCDWFVPDADMPEAPNTRGYEVFRDVNITPAGNTYLYDKSRLKRWELQFLDISTRSKNFLEHVSHGWIGSMQITMVYFGSSVIGTTESAGSMSAAGQLWGTGWVEQNGLPNESASDLWNFNAIIHEFGPDQSF